MAGSDQEAFQSMATVFILQEKTWIERGSGLVRFVFDLRTFALRLVIRPGTPDEFECKLRPRIRSKGPRAYVVRAQAENGTDEHILAVRFEREEDSRSFRRFVEKRDVDHNQKNNAAAHPNQYPQHLRNQTYDTGMQPQQGQGQYAHRHGNRSSSNVPQNPYGAYGGGGGAGGAGAPMRGGNANPYSNNTALGMYGSAGGGSNPQGMAAQSGKQHANYFWTCSRCLQMVDPSLTSCPVCGKLRQNDAPQQAPPQSQGVLQPMHNSSNNAHYGHQQAHHAGNARNTYGSSAMHQIPAGSMPPSSNNYPHYSNNAQMMSNPSMASSSAYYKPNPSHEMTAAMGSAPAKAAPQVPILKLTTVNLDKHNKLFPPKRRNVKEIVHVQLEWLRTHQ